MRAITMTDLIPTIADLLQSTDIGNSQHQWRIEGGAIIIDRAVLRQVLEDAYDPTMPNWPAMATVDFDQTTLQVSRNQEDFFDELNEFEEFEEE